MLPKEEHGQPAMHCMPARNAALYFLKFGKVTARLELISECHLTLKSPLRVCWSKPQFHSSDKHRFWNVFYMPSYFIFFLGGGGEGGRDIHTHTS